ncbi:MAG: glycosyltransferase family 2 protein [Desulfobacteraceae bacterium]|nr:glycosyltransferase family 2 protein [Desulfobacteraceae bacterium]
MGRKGNSKGIFVEKNGELHRVLNDLTIIIPTVGRPILERCLESIARGSVLPTRIIAIDQGENPAVVDWLHSLEAMGLETIHLHSSERSPASARNRGIEQVQTTFVAAIDDDCVAEVDWLEKLEIKLRQNSTAIITGRLEPTGGGIPPTTETSTVPCVYYRPSIRIHSPLNSANMGFALRIAQQIGPFDENLIAAEDNDWGYRALRAGVPIVYAPEVIVYHHHWRDKDQLSATYRTYAWSQGAFYGKHLRRGDWSMALRTAITLIRGVRSLINGMMHNKYDRKVNGYTRITRLIPGLIAGIRDLSSS